MHGEYTGCVNESKQEKDMEFDEWYDRMMDNGDSPLHYLVTQREKLRLAWNESRRISNTPILSAVPSEDEIEKWYIEKYGVARDLNGKPSWNSQSIGYRTDGDLFEMLNDFVEWIKQRGVAG